MRLDGVAPTRDFVTWDAPINVTVAGGYADVRAYSGATSPTQKSLSPNDSCDDWTGGNAARLGTASSASTKAFGAIVDSATCNTDAVYCLQVP